MSSWMPRFVLERRSSSITWSSHVFLRLISPRNGVVEPSAFTSPSSSDRLKLGAVSCSTLDSQRLVSKFQKIPHWFEQTEKAWGRGRESIHRIKRNKEERNSTGRLILHEQTFPSTIFERCYHWHFIFKNWQLTPSNGSRSEVLFFSFGYLVDGVYMYDYFLPSEPQKIK